MPPNNKKDSFPSVGGFNFACDDSADVVAQFVPLYNQIWTNPAFRKNRLEKSFIHEIIHLIQARGSAITRHLVRKFIEDGQYPDVNKFRDIVEPLFVASSVLIKRHHVDFRKLPWAPGNYPELGREIIEIVRRWAQSAHHSLLPVAAQEIAFFAAVCILTNIIPSKSGQGPKILKRLAKTNPPANWQTNRELIDHICVQIWHPPFKDSKSRFLLTPFDLHTRFLSFLSLFSFYQAASPRELVAIIPVILETLSFGLCSFFPLLWTCKRSGIIKVNYEIGDETQSLLEAGKGAMALRSDINKVLAIHSAPCPISGMLKQIIKAIGDSGIRIISQDNITAMFKILLDTMPELIKSTLAQVRYLSCECGICQAMIKRSGNELFEGARGFLSWSKTSKNDLIEAVAEYEDWLLSGCLKDFQMNLNQWGHKEPVKVVKGTPISYRELSAAFCVMDK
jgi:hypothetical protein